jgi:hypothetical protein
VVRSKDGSTIILDHKTSKKKPSSIDVLHHPQLNLYGYCYHEIYGIWPEVIGIHHLVSGECVLAELDREICSSIVEYYTDLQKKAMTPRYVRHMPTEYNSPCVKRDWRSETIEEICPYLDRCWPTYYQELVANCEIKSPAEPILAD